MSEPKTVKCPTCGQPVQWSTQSHWKPFCSERCRLIDLGEWISEGYAIHSEDRPTPKDPEQD